MFSTWEFMVCRLKNPTNPMTVASAATARKPDINFTLSLIFWNIFHLLDWAHVPTVIV